MAWDSSLIHQDFLASGSYNSNSALAKEYAGLKEDGGSRVDDGEGWREIKRDAPPKNAAEYEQLVKDYAKQGFDVKAIDMDGDDFTHSNIAIRPKGSGGSEWKGFREPSDDLQMSKKLSDAKERVANWEKSRNGTAGNVYGDGSRAAVKDLDLGELDTYKNK